MSLLASGSIHLGLYQEYFVISLEEDGRFMSLAALFANLQINAGGAKMSIKSSFLEIVVSLCIHDQQRCSARQKFFCSELTAYSSLLVSREKRGKV